ncbi:PQQ-dependent sugar dehydrogenase [Lysobacter sp. TAF61]|uniref:PQQ-dependent sugar dehydrogenase n=1 Tax=Lysobacter sp. TAF61 TaxID=3233072 RepID=UPI003F9E5CE3
MVQTRRRASRGWVARILLAGLVAALTAALAACGGGGGRPRGSVSPPPSPANRPPVFTSGATATVPEDTAAVFYTATATDPDGNAITFSLAGGVDQARLRITSAGALSFVAAPDFEQPVDANGDNVYLVTIAASDGTVSVTQSLSITVTDVRGAAFRVRRIASGLNFPIFIAPMPDSSGRLFVVEREGRIRIMTANGSVSATPFLDLTGTISIDGERGLLGFATAPDFFTSGRFYVFVTAPDGTIEVRRYLTIAGDLNRADPTSGDAILRVVHARNNHNGGWIGFGPDRMLYVAIGDGGGAGDPDNNGQNTNTLLGKILRLDPAGDAFPADPDRDYAIPAGNPFASAGGAPEVWAYGLRNPFRNNFDTQTGNLLIGDVGQGAIEEIDLMRPGDGGANFGWPILEGTAVFRGGPTAGMTPPVAQYSHGTGPVNGSSVTGGLVYRGPVESLLGEYIFADFVRPNIWSLPIARLVPGTTLQANEFTLRNGDFTPDTGAPTNIVSINADNAGQVYLVDFDGEIFVIETDALGIPQSAALGAPRAASQMSPQQLLREGLSRRFGGRRDAGVRRP